MNLVRHSIGLAVETPAGVVPIPYIIGIGRNYAEHAKEQAAEVPTRPMVFTKSPASACVSGAEIVVPRVCQDAATGGDQVDFEAELAVIIGDGGAGPGGRACRDVAESEALAFVMGYCCGNDVSARWWQKEGSGGQFCRGKSFDTFCPLGPRVTPAAMVGDPQRLRVVCRVNGAVMQDGRTGDMIFSVARLISDLSRGATLPVGTVIMTGTPSGVGMARKPPVWLRDGDVVEVAISGEGVDLGVLTNRVRMER